MKRKIIAFLLAATLTISVFTGCGPVDREAQEAYRQQGITQLQAGDYSKAAESFQLALEESLGRIGRHEVDICYYKALSQFKAGDVLAAIDTYNALIEYDKKNGEAYFLRGSAYLQCAEAEVDEIKKEEFFDKGINDYSEAVSLDDKNYKLYIAIYDNLNALGRTEYAEEFLSRALSLECNTAQEYCDQGYVYLMLENYDKAASLLSTAVEKGCDEAMLYQAHLYQAQGDAEAARGLLETYTAKYPDDVNALHQAGILAINAGAYAEAARILEQAYASEEKGTNQELQLNLIYAYEYAGQFAKALEVMEEYISLYPGDVEAAREYEFLLTRTGTSLTPSERAEAEAEAAENNQQTEDTTAEGTSDDGTDQQ